MPNHLFMKFFFTLYRDTDPPFWSCKDILRFFPFLFSAVIHMDVDLVILDLCECVCSMIDYSGLTNAVSSQTFACSC